MSALSGQEEERKENNGKNFQGYDDMHPCRQQEHNIDLPRRFYRGHFPRSRRTNRRLRESGYATFWWLGKLRGRMVSEMPCQRITVTVRFHDPRGVSHKFGRAPRRPVRVLTPQNVSDFPRRFLVEAKRNLVFWAPWRAGAHDFSLTSPNFTNLLS